jgi:class 3 adenylate cyclase
MDVHRAARIMAAGHGVQVLLSKDTAELVLLQRCFCDAEGSPVFSPESPRE